MSVGSLSFPKMSSLVKILIFLFVIVSPAVAICKESDNFEFECQFWEDVVKLPEKPTVKHLVVKNHSVEMICDGATFQQFRNLTVLNIHPGGITEIQSECFNGLTGLEYVQIMENKVKKIALDSLNGSIVERLWLDTNLIAEINFDRIILPILRSLGLSGNRLTDFSINTNNVPDLRILDLSFNNLTTVNVESISLSFLKLQGNLLADLKADNVRGKFIRMLYLSENKLTEIRGSLFDNVPRVEFVHFEKNPVKLIDFSQFNITALLCTDQMIRLTKKNREAPLSVDVTWDEVQQLILSRNAIDRLDVFNFSEPVKVGELQMDSNSIREIKRGDLVSFKELIALNLTSNRISTIEEGAFEGLTKLHTLDLANNCIHGMSDHMFLNMNSLFKVDLSRNIMTYFVVPGWTPAENSIVLTRYHVSLNI